MSSLKISLEQWKTLVAVVESGGYAQAAEKIHKSQSTLSYAVQKMERLLGVKVFELKGRKAQLTNAGQVLYARGKSLLAEAERLEEAAVSLAAGWEAELRVAVEIVFPTWLLLQCFARFGEERPQTRIELYETVLGGTAEALLEGRVDLAIGPTAPPGFTGEPLMHVRFVPAAAPTHALHALGRELSAADLRSHRHLVIRDTGSKRVRATNVVAHQRWTVSHKATSIRAAVLGLGFAWFPEDSIREELQSGQLKVLPMRDGAERYATLYLIHPDAEAARPGARRLAQIIRERVRSTCPEAQLQNPIG
ncbi:MAG TPA: LysR family transcriptional regulator [Verrucomicrobiae bacterium]|nr:LysR family transcriptional regulator [Verrucomicrobiae bacterium]